MEIVKQNEIHLILLDVMMPVMDGITATAQIREFSNAPIILLTAKSETEDKVLGLNSGVFQCPHYPAHRQIGDGGQGAGAECGSR